MPPSTRPELYLPRASTADSSSDVPLPSLRHLSIWGYLALGVIVFISSAVLVYAIYSCCCSAHTHGPQESTRKSKLLPTWTLARTWSDSSQKPPNIHANYDSFILSAAGAPHAARCALPASCSPRVGGS
ncbi:hypothetical protein BD779DRAFT_1489009 [Infundibulicybe gibba]|nr:hypothetical protein BD779DRAFT_1489009 [Infundibulicybe gibba]